MSIKMTWPDHYLVKVVKALGGVEERDVLECRLGSVEDEASFDEAHDAWNRLKVAYPRHQQFHVRMYIERGRQLDTVLSMGRL